MWWFWTVYGSMIAAMIAWGIWLRRRWQEMPELANVVYDERIKSGELPKSIKRDGFTAAFIQTDGPRRETYRWAAATASIILLPVMVKLFNVIWNFFWVLSEKPRVFEEGLMMHTFCTFLFAMGTIISIIYFSTRRYYSTAPPSLRKQIRGLMGDTA